MSQQSFYFVSKSGNGAVWIGPRPSFEKLHSWANALKNTGITHVVSLIENTEVEHHGLETEGEVLKKLSIGFTRFPVNDFNTPDAAKFLQLIDDLSKRLSQGENLFLHCAGGVGRAGTTASCLLVKQGMSSDAAMELVSKQRGEKSPETDGQANFVRAFQP